MDFLTYRTDYRPTEFFEKYVTSFVPPWYSMTASELTRRTRHNFTAVWSWAFDQLMTQTSTPYAVGVIGSYCTDPMGDSLPGATSRISEIYKSSFAQTIEWFASQRWLDAEIATEYALSLCPVDLSLWDISPVVVPDWWPTAVDGAEQTDIVNLPESAQCENLVNVADSGSLLIGAEGATIPAAELTNVRTWFRLLPFAYEVRGGNLPAAEVVAGFLRRNFWQKAPTGREPVSLFSPSFDGWVPFFPETARAGDLVVVPLLSRMESNNINVWLSSRGAHRPFFPAATLVSGGSPGFDAESWFYKVGNTVVCRMRDWRLGTLEVVHSNEYMLHGQFAFADGDWLHAALEEHQCRLGYVLSICVKHRKNHYSKAEEVRFHKLLNVSFVTL